jgi:hypothetical protein
MLPSRTIHVKVRERDCYVYTHAYILDLTYSLFCCSIVCAIAHLQSHAAEFSVRL